MKRFALLSLAGLALLLGGSLAVILWMTDGGPDLPAPEPAPPAAVAQPEKRAPVVAPPPTASATAVEDFEKPAPKAVPEPPAPPPPVDLAQGEKTLEALVSSKCGAMQLRLGDEMRKGGEQMTGQAILLFDAESFQDGKVKLGQSRLQSPGNMRQSLVACAQMALRGQVIDAPGAKPDERFTLQLVLGMRP